jgi:hypothetical protein
MVRVKAELLVIMVVIVGRAVLCLTMVCAFDYSIAGFTMTSSPFVIRRVRCTFWGS